MSESAIAPADAGGAQHDAPSAAVETSSEPPSIRNSAEAAYDALMAREAEAKPESEAAEPAPVESGPEPVAAVAQPEKLAPPDWLSDKAQVDWNRLPRSVQEGILSRAAASQSAPPDPFVETARSLRGAFEQHGLIPERALPQIVGAWQQLVANPREVLPELAKQFGVELGPPAATQQPPQSDQWVDPMVADLQAKLAAIEARETERTRQEQARQVEVQTKVYREAASELETFSKDKPDFAVLRQDMGKLIASGAAMDLADAYEKAAWANPQTRAARIEAQRKEEDAKRIAEAEKARRSASVNVRSDTSVAPAPGRTMRETMERAADRLFSA
jgi:hypothetical protein